MAATKLAFLTQPAGYTVHGVLATQPMVVAQNADGSTDTAFSGAITLTPSVASTYFYDATEPTNVAYTVAAGSTASAILVSPSISFPSPRPADFTVQPCLIVVTSSAVTYGTGTALQGAWTYITGATGSGQINVGAALPAAPVAGDAVTVRFGQIFPTATINAVAGVATFVGLSLSGHQPTAFVASADGLASATSSTMAPTGTFFRTAELPRTEPTYDYATLVAAYHAAPATTWAVSTGAEFQAALDDSVAGDIIELLAGAEIVGLFTMRDKGADAHILIRTSDMVGLPAAGHRVFPSDIAAMPVVRYSHLAGTPGSSGDVNEAPFVWEPNANGYTFVGICIRENTDSNQNTRAPLNIGNRTDTDPDTQQYNIVLDRCYVFTADGYNCSKAAEVHAKQIVVRDSYLRCGAIPGTEQQALWMFNGTGEMLVENCTLIATTENFITAGAIPPRRLNPQDITFRNCHFYKPPEWCPVQPTYAGTDMSVKNIFELKSGRRVLVEWCFFDGFWPPDQDSCMNVKATASEGALDANTFTNMSTTDFAMRYCSWANTGSGPKFSGRLDSALGDVGRFTMAYTRFNGVGDPAWVPAGNTVVDFRFNGGGSRDIEVAHLTIPTTVWGWLSPEGTSDRARFLDSIVAHGSFGIKKSGVATGNASILSGLPNGRVTGNLVIGGSAADYPSGNNFVASWDGVLVDGAALTTNYGRGNTNLAPSSGYEIAASDGTEPGVGSAVHAQLDAMEIAVAAGTPFDPNDTPTVPGDPVIEYQLEYSADGGATWPVLQAYAADQSATLNTRTLTNGSLLLRAKARDASDLAETAGDPITVTIDNIASVLNMFLRKRRSRYSGGYNA